MEVFFVVVTAGALLGVGIWALLATRHLFTTADRRPGDD
jgi:hypothetical protein